MVDTRDLDLIVLGATGFAGRVAADYISRHGNSRWAIAGRDIYKLKALTNSLRSLPNPPCEEIQLNHLDLDGVRAVLARTRVAANYAGPFSRSGENVVCACAELGVHYVDITGETLWVRQMIDKYEAHAFKSGAILIPFSGFDSVPSDLGVWLVTRKAQRFGVQPPVTKVFSLYSVRGGVNGGTYETMLDMLALSDKDHARFNDPELLVPPARQGLFSFPQISRPAVVPGESQLAPLFFMAPINTKVVYRSQALRLGDNERDKQKAFEYIELMRMHGMGGGVQAWSVMALGKAFEHFGRKSWGQTILRKVGVSPGTGPSAESREKGYFKADFLACNGDQVLAKISMAFAGDPGNRATAALSCESAFGLIDCVKTGRAKKGGFWTPSTALGDDLVRRLQRAGLNLIE